MEDGLTGYYIGTAENPETEVSSDEAGYGNTLYFPHKQYVSNCWGYWLASPSGYDIWESLSSNVSRCVVSVCEMGNVSCDFYANGTLFNGVRPAVYLPSDIKAKKVDGVWELEI